MNRFDKNIGASGEAKIEYLDGEFHVLVPGEYVTCAVTGTRIPVEELRYWSVARQEPYIDAIASLKAEQAAT